MITQQRLLNSLTFVLLLSGATQGLAQENCTQSFDVLLRDEGQGYHFEKKPLENLFCTNKFEGNYFKIVHSTSDEAIRFDHEDKELIRRAANVYYHLTVARNFWIEEIQSEYVPQLPQLTIRLDITNAFSNTRQFKNAELEKNYNNAWSIPEGQTPKFAAEKKKWGKEIWFSPMKKIETREILPKSEGNNPIHESLIIVKDPIVEWNKNTAIYAGLGTLVAPALNQSTLVDTAIKGLGTIAVIYGLVYVTKYTDHWFMDKYYYIDTAMIPEIIYHEFAHIAMSDTMKTVHSVPVIEGMADYFAARIANRRKMYEKIKEFSSNKSKDTLNKSFYHPYLEGSWNATSDFTLSLLWKGKEDFDAQNAARLTRGQENLVNYDALVFKAHKDLNENSDIANDLTRALIKACKEKCTSVRAGVNTLNRVFEKKGMN